MSDEKKSINVDTEDNDYYDLNDFIKKEIEHLKQDSNVAINTLNSKSGIDMTISHVEDLDNSTEKNPNFFKEFRNKLNFESSSKVQNTKLQENITTFGNEDGNFKSDDNAVSNLKSSEMQFISSPEEHLRTVDHKSPSSQSIQNITRAGKHKKTASTGSDKLKKRKKNLNKSNDMHSPNEDANVKFLEKELFNSSNVLTKEHLESFKGKFSYLICTQGGSRCLQTAFPCTPASILDSVTNEEVIID